MIRLHYRVIEFAVATLFKCGDRLVQHCDRCGANGKHWPMWWSENEDWPNFHCKEIAYGDDDQGCLCLACADEVAANNGELMMWVPMPVDRHLVWHESESTPSHFKTLFLNLI